MSERLGSARRNLWQMTNARLRLAALANGCLQTVCGASSIVNVCNHADKDGILPYLPSARHAVSRVNGAAVPSVCSCSHMIWIDRKIRSKPLLGGFIYFRTVPMKFAKAQTFGLGIGLLVAVYAPAFLITGLVRPRIEIAIPLIIAITFVVALILVFLFARPPAGIAEFGFRLPNSGYLAIATAFGLTLGLAVTFLSHLFPSKPPFDVSSFAPWMIGLYFLIGAPIQEEIIFRGLIQSMVERRWMATFSLFGGSLSGAVAFTAALFGVIHLEAGVVVALGAIILGLVAGELRRRSGSLLPAIVVHALFNAADAFWP